MLSVQWHDLITIKICIKYNNNCKWQLNSTSQAWAGEWSASLREGEKFLRVGDQFRNYSGISLYPLFTWTKICLLPCQKSGFYLIFVKKVGGGRSSSPALKPLQLYIPFFYDLWTSCRDMTCKILILLNNTNIYRQLRPEKIYNKM